MRTMSFQLPSMKIDQSTVDGNLEILMTIVTKFLKLPDTWFLDGTRIIIAGDHLTVARVRSAKELRSRDCTPFERLQWATPVMQLFHLQMLLCTTILRTHFGSRTTPRSLGFFITLLDRKRLALDSPNYHAADEILRNVFDGMVVRLWQVELGTTDLEPFLTKLNPDDNLFTTRLSSICDMISSNSTQLANRFSNVNVNAALFLRDMMVYMHLCDVIKAGDIGRLEETLLMITIMFQAGGTKNYANELLRLTYGIRFAWSAQEKRDIMSSMLINTKGKDNGWIPADLFQEHNNLLIKTIHSSKGSNMSWETLANKISTNVQLFSKIAEAVEGECEIPHNNAFHSTVSAYGDILIIAAALKDHDILGTNPQPDVPNVPRVRDLASEGFEKFPDRFEKFVEGVRVTGDGEREDDTVGLSNEVDCLEMERELEEEFLRASLYQE